MSAWLDSTTSRFPHDSREFKSLRDRILDDPVFGQAVHFGFSQLDDIKNLTIIDMGCGEGLISVFFALHGAKVIGFDKRSESVRRARDMAFQWNVQDRCAFTQCYSEQMAICTETVDIVFSRSTLQYTDRERALNECMRILKPGGILVLNENLPYNPIIILYRLHRKLRARSPEAVAYVKSIRGYLTFCDMHKLQCRFSTLTHHECHLFRMLTLGLSQRFKQATWVKTLDEKMASLDALILTRFPLSRHFAWIVSVAGKGKRTF